MFGLAFFLVGGLILLQPALDPGLATFYDRTIQNQINRESPFSIWGQEPSLEWLQTVVKLGAVALAVLVAFVPRRRSLPQIAALSAAVLIASQLAIDHWFYLYLPWFCGTDRRGACRRRLPVSRWRPAVGARRGTERARQ